MRYLILSDIHANLEALEAVMVQARKDGFDSVLCLGDIVGYGADPNACVDWVRANVQSVVRGNHDKVCTGLDNLEWFNPAARASAIWTRSALSEENLDYLRELPAGPVAIDGFQIVHGAPADEDQYLVDVRDATHALAAVDNALSFFGHTHLQGGFCCSRKTCRRVAPVPANADHAELAITPDDVFLVNPGSVGQPRDGDWRAAWAYFDPSERLVTFRRATYAVESAQRKICDAGLPEGLARRLSRGQ